MQTFISILLLVVLFAISYQDFKERKVYFWLFILSGILIGIKHYNKVGMSQFLLNIVINMTLISLIVFVLSMYSKYRMKKSLQQSLGLGDILFFVVISLGFPTLTFLLLFVFSVFFTGILFVAMKKHIAKDQIPLAGFQSLFVALVLLVNLIFNITNLYLV